MTLNLNSSSQGGREEEQVATLEPASDLPEGLFTQLLNLTLQQVQGGAQESAFLTMSWVVMQLLLFLALTLRITG